MDPQLQQRLQFARDVEHFKNEIDYKQSQVIGEQKNQLSSQFMLETGRQLPSIYQEFWRRKIDTIGTKFAVITNQTFERLYGLLQLAAPLNQRVDNTQSFINHQEEGEAQQDDFLNHLRSLEQNYELYQILSKIEPPQDQQMFNRPKKKIDQATQQLLEKNRIIYSYMQENDRLGLKLQLYKKKYGELQTKLQSLKTLYDQFPVAQIFFDGQNTKLRGYIRNLAERLKKKGKILKKEHVIEKMMQMLRNRDTIIKWCFQVLIIYLVSIYQEEMQILDIRLSQGQQGYDRGLK